MCSLQRGCRTPQHGTEPACAARSYWASRSACGLWTRGDWHPAGAAGGAGAAHVRLRDRRRVLHEHNADVRRALHGGVHGSLAAVLELDEEGKRVALAAADEPGRHGVEDSERYSHSELQGPSPGEARARGRRGPAEGVSCGEHNKLGCGPAARLHGVELGCGKGGCEGGGASLKGGRRSDSGTAASEGGADSRAAEDGPPR